MLCSMKSCLTAAFMLVVIAACSSTEPSPPLPTPTGQLLLKFHSDLTRVDPADGRMEPLLTAYGSSTRPYVISGVARLYGAEPETILLEALIPTTSQSPAGPRFVGLVNLATGSIDTLAFMPTGSYFMQGLAPDGRTPLINGDWQTRSIYWPDPATRTLVPYWTAPEGTRILNIGRGRWPGGVVIITTESPEGLPGELVIIDPASGGWTPLPVGSHPTVAGSDLAVSPDGRLLAFVSMDWDIYLISIDGAPAQHAPFPGLCPVFSPDGKFLAYAMPEEVGRRSHQRLMIRRLSDGHTWNYQHQHDLHDWDAYCPQDWIE